MKKIFSASFGPHDHNSFNGEFHYQAERYTRIKMNQKNGAHDLFYYNEVEPNLDVDIFAVTINDDGGLPIREQYLLDLFEKFSLFEPKKLWDYKQIDNVYFIDHHQSHAAYAYLMSGYEESDVLAIDGGGNRFSCIFVDKYGNITDLTNELPLGIMWRMGADAGHFRETEAGKLMGLAAYGKMDDKVYLILDQLMEKHKNLRLKFELTRDTILRDFVRSYSTYEDLAYTLQQFTLDKINEVLPKYKTSENICLAGGVAYNGYMNTELKKMYQNVFVPPAVGDEGQALGSYMHADYVINNNIQKPSVYSGKEHTINERILEGMKYTKMPMEEIYPYVAKRIAEGAIVGWYQGKSESGNRALGNRSILADPRNPDIKDIINSKIKLREDFRPFAPSVLIEHYQEYFDTNQPSPYMSRIMPVHEDKKKIVPGIVHVDGTARIQTVEKSFNEKYYNLIDAFYKETGVPMLLNTSFNCQEPIVETPEDALNTFKRVEMDILVLKDYVIVK